MESIYFFAKENIKTDVWKIQRTATVSLWLLSSVDAEDEASIDPSPQPEALESTVVVELDDAKEIDSHEGQLTIYLSTQLSVHAKRVPKADDIYEELANAKTFKEVDQILETIGTSKHDQIGAYRLFILDINRLKCRKSKDDEEGAEHSTGQNQSQTENIQICRILEESGVKPNKIAKLSHIYYGYNRKIILATKDRIDDCK